VLPVSVSPQPLTVLAPAALLGLVLGLIGAFVADRLSRKVLDSRDARRAGAGDILARLSQKTGSVPATGSDADDLRVLRERTLALTEGTDGVVVVLDRTTGSSESDVPVNLAIATRDAGLRTSLILVGYESMLENGLVQTLDLVLAAGGNERLGTFRESRRFPGLSVYQLPDSLAAFDGRGRGGSLLTGVLNQSDLVVMALGNGASHGTQLAGARHADVLLLLADGHMRRPELSDLSAELSAIGAAPKGLVLVPRGRSVRMDDRREAGHLERVEPSRTS